MTNSTLSSFVNGAISTGLGKLSIVSISLLSFVITTRWLSVEDLGVFVLLKVIVAFLVKFSSLGVDFTVTRFLAGIENEKERKTMVNTVISFRIISILVVSFSALLASNLLFKLFGSSIYSEILIYIPVFLAIDSLISLYGGIFAGNFNFRMIGLSDFINSLLSFLAVIVLVVWQDSGVMGRVHARLFSTLLTLLFVLLFGGIHYRPQLNIKVLKDILKFGFPIYINYFLSFAFLRADTVVIGIFLGPAEIAFYEIAKTIPESLEMLYDAFRAVFYPFISKLYAIGDKVKAAVMINQAVRLLAFAGFLGALFTFLFGKELVVLLFTEKYLPSVMVFGILMIVFTFMVLENTFGAALIAVGEPNKPPIINVFHTAVNFLGYIILITPLGINGLALAGMLGTALSNPLNIYFLRKKQLETRIDIIFKPMCIFAVCLLLNFIFSPSMIIAKIMILVLYLACCYILAVFTRDDIELAMEQGGYLLSRVKSKVRT